ncbi:MAG: acetyl-CoA carboxylase biotin carboxyl carrier protein [Synechococcaceae cyanobacterium SM2_3_2]|nr:acetyl-CoA carboxylase biotin carboxyl carrier protein [Synechococcaceae cyanobacterium SM2_3_2]
MDSANFDKESSQALDWQEIRDLLALVDASSLSELTLEVSSFRLTVKKGSFSMVVPSPAAAPVVAPPPPPPTPPVEVAPAPPSNPPGNLGRPAHWVDIISPMVGTFYSASAPGESPFVQLGDPVQKGQPLCIIEAMKLMNEIEAEQGGKVMEILVDNSQPVEFGQVLMRLDPRG